MLLSAQSGCAFYPLALSLVAFGGQSVLAPTFRVALPMDTIANGNVVSFRYDGGIMTFDVAYHWGYRDDVFGRLDAQVGNTQSFTGGLATLDFGNSAHAYAQVLTPGYTLGSQSGHDYSSVPEPGSLALAAFGLAALVRRRRSC